MELWIFIGWSIQAVIGIAAWQAWTVIDRLCARMNAVERPPDKQPEAPAIVYPTLDDGIAPKPSEKPAKRNRPPRKSTAKKR